MNQHNERSGFGTLTAAALNAKLFAPVRFVVAGILPEGLAILAGPPKFGKSFAIFDIAIAVASGGKAFGKIDCEAGDVLYCAMEDGERRLQDRLRLLLPSGYADDAPDRLYFETVPPRLDDGLIDKFEAWIDRHPDARLIVLDTWVHIKPAGNGRASAYDEDAQGLRPLHLFAKRHPGLAVVVIHHVRKLAADDVFETISGTYGLTGIADTLMVMTRHGDTAKLCGQGRDVEGYEKAIQRDTLTGSWRMLGDASERAKTGERQAVLDELHEADGAALTPAQLATATGKGRTNVQHLLKRLLGEGLVQKAGYGKWKLSDNPSQRSHHSHLGDDDHRDSEQCEQCEQSEQSECDLAAGMRPFALGNFDAHDDVPEYAFEPAHGHNGGEW